MLLFYGDSALIAGRNNIDSVDILPQDTLLISFKYGLFLDDNANIRAALNIALAIDEFFAEYLLHPALNSDELGMECPLLSVKLIIEMSTENPQFSENVFEQLCYLNPAYEKKIRLIPSIKDAPQFEKTRYLASYDKNLTPEFKQSIIQHLLLGGEKPAPKLTERAFENIKLIKLKAGERLIQQGDKALFIYIPLSAGLEGYSKNQTHFFPKAWTPLGHVGVIQELPRTATIIAQKEVECLMIPSAVYLAYWHIEYHQQEIYDLLQEKTKD
jgi:hypothetical protein